MKSEKVARAFGKALKRRRIEAGLSQIALAEHSDLDRTYISLLETGRRQPSLMAFLALARAVRVRPATLLGDTLDQLPQGIGVSSSLPDRRRLVKRSLSDK